MGKTVVAISSYVMRGPVGLRASGFALERRGITLWAAPTVVLPWHPGLGPSTRLPIDTLPTQLDELAALAPQVNGVLTGFFQTADQVRAAARFIDAVRAARPDAPIVVDPVMGDEEGRYVPDQVAEAMRDVLLPRADVATPNVHELNDVAGAPTPEAARRLGVPTVVVTSAQGSPGEIGIWLVEKTGGFIVRHRRFAQAPKGTGDLFGGMLISKLVTGSSAAEAVETAAAATFAVIDGSSDDVLNLSGNQDAIIAPNLAAVRREPLP